MTQTQPQHTPGPWYVDPLDDDLVYSEIGWRIAVTSCDGQDDMADAEITANSHLVAAAPDLLEAINQAVQALNTAPRFAVPHLSTDSYQIAAACDRAIAKAKG